MLIDEGFISNNFWCNICVLVILKVIRMDTKAATIDFYKKLLYLAGSILSKGFEQQNLLENLELEDFQEHADKLLELLCKTMSNLTILGSRFVDRLKNNTENVILSSYAEIFSNVGKVLQEAEQKKTENNATNNDSSSTVSLDLKKTNCGMYSKY